MRVTLTAVSILGLVLFCLMAAIDIDTASRLTHSARNMVTMNFDWLLLIVTGLTLVAAIALIFHPWSRTKLGFENEKPEFPVLAWFAMLFSAGLGPGLLYWGTAEPVTHYLDNPFDGLFFMPDNPATTGIIISVFHWGLHGWGMYVIAGLAIAIGAFRHEHELTFSTALIPVLGKKAIAGKTGSVIDLIALYGTVFGVATSVGLTVGVMNATMEPVTGLAFDVSNQIAMMMVVTGLGIFSVLTGVARGIRRISESNIWLSFCLLILITLLGPTLPILGSVLSNTIAYITAVLPMGFWIASEEAGQSWQADWTVFYWGWWLAWTPFVALFIARISRGRTVREFLMGVLAVPTLITIIWMSIFGGVAIDQEVATGLIGEAISRDYSLATIATINGLVPEDYRLPVFLILFFLLFTWLITSLDSATLVICHLTRADNSVTMKVVWGCLLGITAGTLLLIGGISALQAASIIIGLPMAFVMLLVLAATVQLIRRGTRESP